MGWSKITMQLCFELTHDNFVVRNLMPRMVRAGPTCNRLDGLERWQRVYVFRQRVRTQWSPQARNIGRRHCLPETAAGAESCSHHSRVRKKLPTTHSHRRLSPGTLHRPSEADGLRSHLECRRHQRLMIGPESPYRVKLIAIAIILIKVDQKGMGSENQQPSSSFPDQDFTNTCRRSRRILLLWLRQSACQ
jgi:hypothetical protein